MPFWKICIKLNELNPAKWVFGWGRNSGETKKSEILEIKILIYQ